MFTRRSAVAHLKLHQVTLADFEARFGTPEPVVDLASNQPAAVLPNSSFQAANHQNTSYSYLHGRISGAGDAATSEVFITFFKVILISWSLGFT